jgi:NAD(P)-dependent dehydrogenase (short-subunit alcohol dehydrogenase family)
MGRVLCATLSAQGWHVLGIDQSSAALDQMATSINCFTPLAIDLRDAAMPSLAAQAVSSLPSVMGLVNLAGISEGDVIDRQTDDSWDNAFAVNVTPAMRLIRQFSPQMRLQKQGSIVNVGSPVGLIGARKPAYAASKAALLGLTMSSARNLGIDNIRVNLLLPGPTITGMTQDWDAERRAAVAEGSFLKRLCTAQEIANVVGFLLSDASSYMTGSVVDMTAGTMFGH